MARVVMVFEDTKSPLGEETVKVTLQPSFETMMKMKESGGMWTSAQSYALFAANQVRAESKKKTPTRILIPKVRL